MRIAIAHDDDKFCAQLAKLLETQSHVVDCLKASEGVGAKAAGAALLVLASSTQAQAVRVIQAIRAQPGGRELPILCVNPQGRSPEGVAMLDSGADDFINRPFNGQIFLARVRTLLRRSVWSGAAREEDASSAVVENGSLRLQMISRRATSAGKPLDLTRLEFDLLAYFVRHPDRAFSRQELLEAVWNYPHDVETRTLDKHVESLRRKLGSAASRIVTVHGHGYRLAAEVPATPRPSR